MWLILKFLKVKHILKICLFHFPQQGTVYYSIDSFVLFPTRHKNSFFFFHTSSSVYYSQKTTLTLTLLSITVACSEGFRTSSSWPGTTWQQKVQRNASPFNHFVWNMSHAGLCSRIIERGLIVIQDNHRCRMDDILVFHVMMPPHNKFWNDLNHMIIYFGTTF